MFPDRSTDVLKKSLEDELSIHDAIQALVSSSEGEKFSKIIIG